MILDIQIKRSIEEFDWLHLMSIQRRFNHSWWWGSCQLHKKMKYRKVLGLDSLSSYVEKGPKVKRVHFTPWFLPRQPLDRGDILTKASNSVFFSLTDGIIDSTLILGDIIFGVLREVWVFTCSLLWKFVASIYWLGVSINICYIETLLYSYLILVELDRLACARGFTSHMEGIFHKNLVVCCSSNFLLLLLLVLLEPLYSLCCSSCYGK